MSELVCFMNMCMIDDNNGHVLVLDKVNDSYTGITFPGGHVESDESFAESIVREVREETGLTIHQPVLCGVYHWFRDEIRYVVFLYRTNQFEGTLRGSEEGEVYWIPESEFLGQKLALGMARVWNIMHSEVLGECQMIQDAEGYVEKLF